jgi:hypothetical protein
MRDAEGVCGVDDAKGGVRRARRRRGRGSEGGMQKGSACDWPGGRRKIMDDGILNPTNY